MSEQDTWKDTVHSAPTDVTGTETTSLDQIDSIYEHGQLAFETWSTLSIAERVRYLRQLRLYITNHLQETVDALCENTGKVPSEAILNEILPTLDTLEYVEKNARKVLGIQPKPTPAMFRGKTSQVEYMPRGLVLVISPWNYPLYLTMVPIINALAAGNTVVFKVSEIVPGMGRFFETLFYNAGFPGGVVQAVHGDGQLGRALLEAKPDYVFFTGSAETGRAIQKQMADAHIPIHLELGGKDAMIVYADANLERAAAGGVWGAFTNSGQVCISVERLFVEEAVFPEFLEKLVDKTQSLVIGADQDADIGAMSSEKQVEIVREHIEDALAKGARLHTGLPPDQWDFSEGLFLAPMILTNVSWDMKLMQEETFGPVMAVSTFTTEKEAVAAANKSLYGLNASVWSLDLEKAHRTAARLICGGITINDVIITVANPHLPFGGTKHSGSGRDHGPGGLRMFCHEKAFMIDPGRSKREVSWYPYAGKYPIFFKLCRALFGRRRNWLAVLSVYGKLKRRS